MDLRFAFAEEIDGADGARPLDSTVVKIETAKERRKVLRRMKASPRQTGLFRRSRFNDVIYAASFVERGGHKFRWRLGDQAPEETAVPFSRCSTFADWLCEIKLDVAAGLDRGSKADRADATSGYHEDLIGRSRPAIVQSAD